MCVCVLVLYTYRVPNSAFYEQSEDTLTCLYIFQGLFEGSDLVLRLGLELGLGQEVCRDGQGHIRSMQVLAKIEVQGWVCVYVCTVCMYTCMCGLASLFRESI